MRTSLRLSTLALLTVPLAAQAQPGTPLPPVAVSAPVRDATLPRTSPSALVSQTFGVTTATVSYGRPAMRGRTLFGATGVVPDGQVWRSGADEATAFSVTTDIAVEGQALAAGTYGLFSIPEDGGSTWTIVFSRTPRQWGAFTYDAKNDALRVRVHAERVAPPVDRFTIGFDAMSDSSAVMTLSWGDVRVPVRLAVDTPRQLAARADAEAAGATDWRVPFRYAQYALTNRVLLDAGSRWADRAATLEGNYATVRLRALYAAERGDLAEAARLGDDALRLGRSQSSPPQGLTEFADRVEGWRTGTR